MPRRKIATITHQDVAAHLARKTKESRARDKTVDALMSQFDATTIKEALKDRRRGKKNVPIDLGWYVKEMMKLYRNKDCTGQTKMNILDRMLDLIHLGAIQDKKLLREFQSSVSDKEAGESTDPFDENPPLRIARPRRKRA